MSAAAIGKRWRPSPLIIASVVLHGLLLGALVLDTRAWPWILLAFAVNHVGLTAIGLWPRSAWLGANITTLPPAAAARNEIALTIDDGPDPAVTPAVLTLLDQYAIKASFFCIGAAAARYPELCRSILERGHTIENHTQHHWHYFSFLGLSGLTHEIAAAQTTLGGITGRPPRFFRAPAGLRSPLLDPVLTKLGLRLAAWTRRGFDTRTADPAVVSRRLLKGLRPGSILLLHDGNAARSAASVPVILAVLPVLAEAAAAAGLHFIPLDQAIDHET
jgi:peptidoglycan/xylan/chitin deacetylase (PgdA/CDA1 family)